MSLEPLQLIQIHASILTLPVIKGSLTYTMLCAYVKNH
jgi:hypothetical protein